MSVRAHWQPLKRKLPLLISALLVVVVIIVSALAYRQVEDTLIGAARERVTNGSQRLADLLTGGAWGVRAEAQHLASDSSIERYLAGPRTGSARIAAQRVLERDLSNSTRMVSVALWNRARTRVLAVGSAALGRAGFPAADAVPHDSERGGSWIGPLVIVGDSVVFDAIAPVFGPSRDTVGFIVETRRLSTEWRQVTNGFTGTDAELMLGNGAGGVWTDLAKPVAGPPLPVEAGRPVQFTTPDGEVRLGAAAMVPPTPWMIWVEIRRAAVLGPARHFLLSMAVAALFIIASGIVVAWLLSNQLTAPLAEVTRAAEDLASGDYARRVSLVRADELGRLATAFNSMAQQVEDSRHALEERVNERTRELQEALEGLRRAQDELVRRERLAMLGQLAGGVGHELRNPLGVMTNALYYLGVVLADAPSKVHEYLDILRTQIGLSEKIVTDLLDFARVKPPQREWTALDDLVAQQLDRVAVPAGICIERAFPTELPPVCVDATQIGQVVLNLVTNAVQAMVGSRACDEVAGTLLLRGRVHDAGHVQLEVRDSGPGILSQHLDKIFEPLFTTKPRGIGLGLAVSRTLARANGGELTVLSEPGAGATFTLVMPTTQAGAA